MWKHIQYFLYICNYNVREVMEIKNGDIIRLKNDKTRDWVAIEPKKCFNKFLKKKKNKNYFHLFGGLWYNGDATTDKPYGKYAGILDDSMIQDVTVVGNIENKEDYEKYKETERL